MKCPECGAEVEASEKFCGNCGAPTAPASSPPDVPQPEVSSRDETILSAAPPMPNIEEVQQPPVPPAAPEPVYAPAAEPAPPPITPQTARPSYAPPPSQGQTKGKSKTGLIIAIVAVVLLLLCCCCVAAVVLFLTQTAAGQNLMREFTMLAPALRAWA